MGVFKSGAFHNTGLLKYCLTFISPTWLSLVFKTRWNHSSRCILQASGSPSPACHVYRRVSDGTDPHHLIFIIKYMGYCIPKKMFWNHHLIYGIMGTYLTITYFRQFQSGPEPSCSCAEWLRGNVRGGMGGLGRLPRDYLGLQGGAGSGMSGSGCQKLFLFFGGGWMI
jgi:hypothetical protein